MDCESSGMRKLGPDTETESRPLAVGFNSIAMETLKDSHATKPKPASSSGSGRQASSTKTPTDTTMDLDLARSSMGGMCMSTVWPAGLHASISKPAKSFGRETSAPTTASCQTFLGLEPVPWFTRTCSSPWSAEVPSEVSFPVLQRSTICPALSPMERG